MSLISGDSQNTENKLLGAVGLAARARKCIVGTEICVETMRKNKGFLLVVAGGISENTEKKLVKTAIFHKIPYTKINAEKDELARAVGKKSNAAAVLIIDNGFVNIIKKLGIEIHTTDTEVLE